MEREFETESVIEYVVREEKEVTGSGEKDDTEETGASAVVSKVCGFGDKNVDDDADSEDAECQAETGSFAFWD